MNTVSMIRKFVNELTIQEVIDIVNSYEGCVEKNWVTHEESSHVKYTFKFLKIYLPNYKLSDLHRTGYQSWEYEAEMAKASYRRLALEYIEQHARVVK